MRSPHSNAQLAPTLRRWLAPALLVALATVLFVFVGYGTVDRLVHADERGSPLVVETALGIALLVLLATALPLARRLAAKGRDPGWRVLAWGVSVAVALPIYVVVWASLGPSNS